MAGTTSHDQPGPSAQTESTNAFSEGHAERRLANRCRPPPGSSSEATNAFSEGDIEARMQARQSGVPGQTISVEAATVHEVDIASLPQLLECDYRVVVLPDRAFDTPKLTADRGEWIATAGGARCLAIAQTAEHASCAITSPIHFELFYCPDSDSVRARNRDKVVIEFDPVRSPDTPDAPDKVSLKPYLTTTIASGSWRVRANSHSFRILISPRRHDLHLLGRRPAQEVAGTKRRWDVENVVPDAEEQQVIKHLGSLAELSDGEKVLLHATTGSYQLVHLKSVANTRASKVFQARHSDYPGEIVIVKVMKRDIGIDPERYAISWQREYDRHRGLEYPSIVKLFAGDARLLSLVLEHVPSHDLSTPSWRSRTTHMFLGTRLDAARILTEMAGVLEYLATEGILHNDIKPANILYDRARGATLIDFGLVTEARAAPCRGGTPWYVAPEFIEGRRGAEAEVWAMGVVMLFLLAAISLPESRQVGGWKIAKVGDGGEGGRSEERALMEEWLDVVDETKGRLRGGDRVDQVVVVRMLHSNPENRVTASELVQILKGETS